MRRYWFVLFLLAVAVVLVCPTSFLNAESAPAWSVYFSPNGGCTDAIVKELGNAKSSVYVQAYSFTSEPIAKALTDAYKRGVKVQTILDKSNRTQKYSAADFLLHADIPTYVDAAHAINHNKVMVIDGDAMITGLFNFMRAVRAAEEKNAENLLVIRDKALAEKYIANWKLHAGHSEPYKGRELKGKQ